MLELYIYGNQIARYTGLSSSGNGNGTRVTLTGVETLGGPTDVFRIVVRQIGPGQTAFRNGQLVDIHSWPDNVLVASSLNPQHDQFNGRASSGTHQIFTSQRFTIDLNGFTGTTVQYGPGANPPRGETLPFDALMTEPPPVPCFAAGTLIACPGGWRDVADLRPGDLVTTRDHGPQTVVWTAARRVVGRGDLAPVRFAPGSIGNGRDLLVSPQHRMLVAGWRVKLLFGEDEVLVPARHLVDGDRITRVEMPAVTYVHVLLERHEVLDAEGAAAESLLLGPYVTDAILGPLQGELAGLVRQATARRCLRAWEAEALSGRSRAA